MSQEGWVWAQGHTGLTLVPTLLRASRGLASTGPSRGDCSGIFLLPALWSTYPRLVLEAVRGEELAELVPRGRRDEAAGGQVRPDWAWPWDEQGEAGREKREQTVEFRLGPLCQC